ncbi:MAG: hypothetical protein WA863_11520 [Methyloceanibacter sp.]
MERKANTYFCRRTVPRPTGNALNRPKLTPHSGKLPRRKKCLTGKTLKACYFYAVKTLLVRDRIWPRPRVAVSVLVLTFLSSIACASEYCTKEQYERDNALITGAFSNGTLLKGPKSLRDSILVEEGMWFGMNYPKQIAFMQSYECAMAGASGKHLLYMDVRSLGTGKLLSTWTLGALKPAEEPYNPTNPETPGPTEDENRIGLTGKPRAVLIKTVVDECRSKSDSPTFCSCYANAMADSLSIKELNEASAAGNVETGITALRPKLEAAAKRCVTN